MKKSNLICGMLIPLFVAICSVESMSQPDVRIKDSTPSTVSSRPSVKMRLREMRFGKPPLVKLYFDVVLRNNRAEPRWFLLPKSLGAGMPSLGTKGGVDGIEVFAPRGKGRVIIGHFLGTGGFQALLLPGGAKVRIRLFRISFWGDLPEHIQVEVLTAKRLTIGAEEVNAWFGVSPLSSNMADIGERADNPMRILSARHTPDNKEVATVIEEDQRFKLQVALNRKK